MANLLLLHFRFFGRCFRWLYGRITKCGLSRSSCPRSSLGCVRSSHTPCRVSLRPLYGRRAHHRFPHSYLLPGLLTTCDARSVASPAGWHLSAQPLRHFPSPSPVGYWRGPVRVASQPPASLWPRPPSPRLSSHRLWIWGQLQQGCTPWVWSGLGCPPLFPPHADRRSSQAWGWWAGQWGWWAGRSGGDELVE